MTRGGVTVETRDSRQEPDGRWKVAAYRAGTDAFHGWLWADKLRPAPSLEPSDGVIVCAYCRKNITVRNDGRVRQHGHPARRCPSSGTWTGAPAPR